MLEIFKAADGGMRYKKVDKQCWRYSDQIAHVNFAIRAKDFPDLLAMFDGDGVLQPFFTSKSLAPSYKASEIDSLVVFEDWCDERTPAVATYKRNDDGEFVRNWLCSGADKIPQCFWEILYPSKCTRTIAKVRARFFPEYIKRWYFIGKNTKFLYSVGDLNTNNITAQNDFVVGSKLKEFGLSDGLRGSEFFEAECGYFRIEALDDTDYRDRKICYPEDIVASVCDSPDIEAELRELLTEDEFSLIIA